MSFEARYHGTCSACAGHIAPGEQVRYESNRESRDLVHDVCPDDPSVSLLPGEKACTVCFLVHPEGACDA